MFRLLNVAHTPFDAISQNVFPGGHFWWGRGVSKSLMLVLQRSAHHKSHPYLCCRRPPSFFFIVGLLHSGRRLTLSGTATGAGFGPAATGLRRVITRVSTIVNKGCLGGEDGETRTKAGQGAAPQSAHSIMHSSACSGLPGAANISAVAAGCDFCFRGRPFCRNMQCLAWGWRRGGDSGVAGKWPERVQCGRHGAVGTVYGV